MDLLDLIEDIGPDDDDKLARLREFLNGVSGEKVLIFSEAETTVDYLFEQIESQAPRTAPSPNSAAATETNAPPS